MQQNAELTWGQLILLLSKASHSSECTLGGTAAFLFFHLEDTKWRDAVCHCDVNWEMRTAWIWVPQKNSNTRRMELQHSSLIFLSWLKRLSSWVGYGWSVLMAEVEYTMAKPTSAFFRAGPSLVPSPVTATTCLCSTNVLSIIPERQEKQ